ncbi:MAG: hypothetical protein O2894_02430 [Planctomycetota bacterium]|nr:hypothetical protein [Planctomycetota bacterium]
MPRTRFLRPVVASLGVLWLVAAVLDLAPGALVGTANARNGAVTGRSTWKPTRDERARIELGRRLFYEPLASPSGQRSCASCHAPDHGWSDPEPQSVDDFGTTSRHSQTLLDAAYHVNAHWDGEFSSVEALVLARLSTPPGSSGSYGGVPTSPRTPPRSPVTPPGDSDPRRPAPGTRQPLVAEHALSASGFAIVPIALEGAGRYAEGFKAAFGASDITLPRIAQALAAFVHTIESTTSPYDRFRAGDRHALDVSARRGLALFEGRAGCNACHRTDGPEPFFTDFGFHNTGVARDGFNESGLGPDSASKLRLRILRGLPQVDGEIPGFEDFLDSGRGVRTGAEMDRRAFKTPTLRDVAKRGPYMHDGHLATLTEVVRYYAAGCGDDPERDARVRGFTCSPQDERDLVAFLTGLSGETRAALPTEVWRARAQRTRLRFLDATAKPMRGLHVRLVPEGDPLPVRKPVSADPLELVTDAAGYVRFSPGTHTHLRIVLAEGLLPVGGALVPDTCDRADVTVPVAGRMTIVATYPLRETPPELLVSEQVRSNRRLPQPAVRTTFVRQAEPVRLTDGWVVRYEGWARSDAGATITIEFPGRSDPESEGRGRRKAQYPIQAGAEYRIDLR